MLVLTGIVRELRRIFTAALVEGFDCVIHDDLQPRKCCKFRDRVPVGLIDWEQGAAGGTASGRRQAVLVLHRAGSPQRSGGDRRTLAPDSRCVRAGASRHLRVDSAWPDEGVRRRHRERSDAGLGLAAGRSQPAAITGATRHACMDDRQRGDPAEEVIRGLKDPRQSGGSLRGPRTVRRAVMPEVAEAARRTAVVRVRLGNSVTSPFRPSDAPSPAILRQCRHGRHGDDANKSSTGTPSTGQRLAELCRRYGVAGLDCLFARPSPGALKCVPIRERGDVTCGDPHRGPAHDQLGSDERLCVANTAAREASTKPRGSGGGLEPPITGPEPAVLPITPPPKGERSGYPAAPSSRTSPRPASSRSHEPAEADERPDRHGRRSPRTQSPQAEPPLPARWRHVRVEAQLVGDGLRRGTRGRRRSRARPRRCPRRAGCGPRRQRLPRVACPAPRRRIASSGTPCSQRGSGAGCGLGEAVALLAPAGDDDRRRHAPLVELERRGRAGPASTGDGRPSYWAAPSTTMASAGRASSRRLAIHTWTNVMPT